MNKLLILSHKNWNHYVLIDFERFGKFFVREKYAKALPENEVFCSCLLSDSRSNRTVENLFKRQVIDCKPTPTLANQQQSEWVSE